MEDLTPEGWPERIGFCLGEASFYVFVAFVVATIIIALWR